MAPEDPTAAMVGSTAQHRQRIRNSRRCRVLLLA
jgi:hypothetical protein